jgi:hypothetical protein
MVNPLFSQRLELARAGHLSQAEAAQWRTGVTREGVPKLRRTRTMMLWSEDVNGKMPL